MSYKKMPSADSWLWVFRAGIGLILLASLLFMLGFSTNHWYDDDTVRYGLWERCVGAQCSAHTGDELTEYHVATQATQIVALFFYAMGPLMHFCFYISKRNKDTGWRSRIFDTMYCLGWIFHLISVVIFGLEHNHLYWSFSMSTAAVAIAFFGIVLVIISRSKALVKFRFRTNKHRIQNNQSQRRNKVGSMSSSRSSTPQSHSSSGHHSAKSVIQHKRSLHNKPDMVSPLSSNQEKQQHVNVNINIINPPTQPVRVPYNSSPSVNQQAQPYPFPMAGPSSNATYASSYINSQTGVNASPGGDPDPNITKVIPAPIISQVGTSDSDANFQSRNTFGPSEKQRGLNPHDGRSLGTIREVPSVPPEFQVHSFSTPDSSPPPYSAVVSHTDIVEPSNEKNQLDNNMTTSTV